MRKGLTFIGTLLLSSSGRSAYANFINRGFITMKKSGSGHLVPKYIPKSANQKQYVNYLKSPENKIIFAVGPAGTGKTLFACTYAIQELKTGNIDKIVITRPTVPVEEDLGFLPGNINKKMDPWTRPIFDIFLENYPQRDIDAMVHAGTIEISPLAYMRGRTFKKCFIIADEMQNSTPNQMMMLTTRIGTGSRMVITGDLKQSDKGLNSGLSDFIDKFTSYKQITKSDLADFGIKLIELDTHDVERSPVVSKILEIYSGKPAEKNNASISQSTNDKNSDAALMPITHVSKIFTHVGY